VDPGLGADWDDWIKKILMMSPVMRSFVRDNPLMYPQLTRILDEVESARSG
jgi:hypothetical protein